MDFALSDEQEDFVDAIRRYCDHECGTPDQRERLTEGYTEHHNETIYKEMAELGWLGVTIPEEYGGSGGTMLDACIFMEETSRALAPIGGYATTLIVAGATKRFGTEDQKQEILGGIAGGAVEAIAMTEPEAGSDVGALSCKAEKVDDGFLINGQKVFCSNAHISDHVLVVCRTDNSGGKHDGMTMIWVPREVEGMEVVPIETMGGRETNTVYFDECEVPSVGAPRPRHPRLHHLRRHLRDPARHHRQDARPIAAAAAPRAPVCRHPSRSAPPWRTAAPGPESRSDSRSPW